MCGFVSVSLKHRTIQEGRGVLGTPRSDPFQTWTGKAPWRLAMETNQKMVARSVSAEEAITQQL